jgi:hypothetical protein
VPKNIFQLIKHAKDEHAVKKKRFAGKFLSLSFFLLKG